MRILLDQNVPLAVGRALSGHTVETAFDRGWEELANGDLLKAAEAAGFEMLVSADQNIVYQQNMSRRPVGLVVLSTNHWPTLKAHLERLRQVVDRLEPRGYAYVECGLAPKRRRMPTPKI